MNADKIGSAQTQGRASPPWLRTGLTLAWCAFLAAIAGTTAVFLLTPVAETTADATHSLSLLFLLLWLTGLLAGGLSMYCMPSTSDTIEK